MLQINPKLLKKFLKKKDFNAFMISNNIYSEEETIIGIWRDGKPIYRKVFYSSTPQIFSSRTSDITLGNVDNLKLPTEFRLYAKLGTASGFMDYSSNSTWAGNVFSLNQTNTYYAEIGKNNIKFYRQAGSNLEATTTLNEYVCIIEYTKTTD